jgi:hypothetical protein
MDSICPTGQPSYFVLIMIGTLITICGFIGGYIVADRDKYDIEDEYMLGYTDIFPRKDLENDDTRVL